MFSSAALFFENVFERYKRFWTDFGWFPRNFFQRFNYLVILILLQYVAKLIQVLQFSTISLNQDVREFTMCFKMIQNQSTSPECELVYHFIPWWFMFTDSDIKILKFSWISRWRNTTLTQFYPLKHKTLFAVEMFYFGSKRSSAYLRNMITTSKDHNLHHTVSTKIRVIDTCRRSSVFPNFINGTVLSSCKNGDSHSFQNQLTKGNQPLLFERHLKTFIQVQFCHLNLWYYYIENFDFANLKY